MVNAIKMKVFDLTQADPDTPLEVVEDLFSGNERHLGWARAAWHTYRLARLDPDGCTPDGHEECYDPEVVELCNAMNALPGITTLESCCGHGKIPFRIFFHDLSRGGGRFIRASAFGFGWTISFDVFLSPPVLLLESKKKGEMAYSEAASIAKTIGSLLRNSSLPSQRERP